MSDAGDIAANAEAIAPDGAAAQDGRALHLLLCVGYALHGLGQPVTLNDLQATAPLTRPLALSSVIPLLRRIGYQATVVDAAAYDPETLPQPFLFMRAQDRSFHTVLQSADGAFTVMDPATKAQAVWRCQDLRQGQILLLKRQADEAGESWKEAVLRRVRGVLGSAILASVLINLFQLATPLASMVIFNKVLGHQALSTLQVVAIGAAIIYCFEALVRTMRGYISVHTGARLDAEIGGRLMAHLLRLPLR